MTQPPTILRKILGEPLERNGGGGARNDIFVGIRVVRDVI